MLRAAGWMGIVVLLMGGLCWGDERPFAFVYDTNPEMQGDVELEQYFTFASHTKEDPGFRSLEFRHEIEYGLADNFTVAAYVATWNWEKSRDREDIRFDTASLEGIYYILNPNTSFVGLGVYTEVAVGKHEIELENKLLIQKDIGRLELAYNLIVETEWGGVFGGQERETEGIIGHALGASYELGKGLRIGAEATIESIFSEWRHYETTVVYAGPDLAYRGGRHWWITVAPMVQLTDVEEEPTFQLRLIAAFEF